ncbi:MAG: hypothetical protein ACI9K5_003530 [Gammaproteobacteria bacterium]|jgi:hypothetical protein
MPGVELLDASGHEDVTFEIHGFTIDVEDRGVIAFGALTRDSFEYSDHLPIQAIGGYEVIVVMEGYIGVYRAETKEPMRSTGWGYGFDVGPKGLFSRFFPFPLATCRASSIGIRRSAASWPAGRSNRSTRPSRTRMAPTTTTP